MKLGPQRSSAVIFALGLIASTAASMRARAEDFLEPLAHGPTGGNASVLILSPAQGELVADGAVVKVQLKVDGFELGQMTEGSGQNGLAISDKGQHLHLIADNGEYMAVYDVSKPVEIKDLAEGVHTIEVFASRSWHESVKTPGARDQVTFYVGPRKKGRDPIKAGAPLLTYSRPKGVYKAADAKIMIDFYVTNATLSPRDYGVKITVDGKEQTVHAWRPYAVKGLAAGEHTFKVELVDAISGKLAPGDFNATERKIKIE